ncbi:MAG: 30S ribosomal protein S6e [Candidatus Bathyarchaeota archaeon]|nr:MAG: 30S ribosomal protein S6e [Candidatus Bathyarchaeota archaeon]
MAKFKLSISDSTGKTQSMEIEELQAQQLIGKKIGDKLKGAAFEMPDQELQITGGSDKDGTPMRRDVQGGVRKSVMLSRGPGYKATTKGMRKRKKIRGNVITEDIVQVNLKIVS